MRLHKIIVTGANGVGKSHFARRLAVERPEVPLVSYDAIKLETGWRQRPRAEIDAALEKALQRDAWILEGGPSLLPLAAQKADALVWIDTPESVRAWRLLTRPLKHIGASRPELPAGNVDWPVQQYRFALRSLRNRSKLHAQLLAAFSNADGLETWRCRNGADLASVQARWAGL